MYKNGMSLMILTITIMVLAILSVTVILTGMNFRNQTDYIKFETNINLIEKTIRKEYIKNNIIGINLKKYEENANNEQEQFNFAPEVLNELLEEIKNISDSIQIDEQKEDYYLLNRQYLKELGLNEIYGDYLVNYKNGYVFALEPFEENEDKIYTTQYIEVRKIAIRLSCNNI